MAVAMDTKIARAVALVALLIYASGTGSALCDLCPAPLLDGTLTIPNTGTLQLKASTQADATLTGPHGAISGRASVTCRQESSTLCSMVCPMVHSIAVAALSTGKDLPDIA